MMGRYDDIDPMDLDPETGAPYAGYSSPALDTSFHDGEMDVGEAEPVAEEPPAAGRDVCVIVTSPPTIVFADQLADRLRREECWRGPWCATRNPTFGEVACAMLYNDANVVIGSVYKMPGRPLPAPDERELEDLIDDAINDSLDIDWTSHVGAKAVLRALAGEGLQIVRVAAEPAADEPEEDEDEDDEDEGYPGRCTNPGGHEWPRVEEHERCLCIHCGADGDA